MMLEEQQMMRMAYHCGHGNRELMTFFEAIKAPLFPQSLLV